MRILSSLGTYAFDREGWEATCARCARCCFEREVDEAGEVYVNYASPCEHLDMDSHLCNIYESRFRDCSDCHKVTPITLIAHSLPAECAYLKRFS